jgi:amidase
LRTRRISAFELVEHTIARIEALDKRPNAVVIRDFARARQAAVVADLALARGEWRPLLGIPITIKEAFNVAVLPTTWSYPQIVDFEPKEDALIVLRLKRAGAVLLGKTNVPLGFGDFQSFNDVYGTTNNPWETGRSPGGSSRASAAALAVGFGPSSFRSDIGRSLGVPAHFCGVYAHKPTLGVVPFRGYGMPPLPALPRDIDLAVIGPIARTAADLALALDVIPGPDEEREGTGYRLASPPTRHKNLRSFRVLVTDTHPLVPTNSAVRTAMGQLAERLEKAGAKVARTSALLPNLAESARLYVTLLAAVKGAGLHCGRYAEMQRLAAALTPDDDSLAAAHARGSVTKPPRLACR